MPTNLGSFNSLGAFATHLAGSQVRIGGRLAAAADEIGRVLATDMQAYMGEYHGAVGPYAGWAKLAPSTMKAKIKAGQAPPDNPLIATGAMHNSVSYDVRGFEVEAGFTDPKMKFHEFGTSKMPPRPVVGPVAFENIDTIRKLAAAAAVAGLIDPKIAAGLFSFAASGNVERISR